MAKIEAIGFVTRDPEVKQTKGGKDFLKFSISDSKSKKVDNGWEELAQQFLECTLWDDANKYADLRKGDRITVYGEFYARKYESNGVEKQSLDVKVDAIKIIKRKDENAGGGGGGFSNRSYGQQAPQAGVWGQGNQGTNTQSWGTQADDVAPF